MPQQNRTLDDLRSEIDEIDDSLHDLLIRRAELTQFVAKVKQPAAESGQGSLVPALRPSREAGILRRLLLRHRGGLPPRVIVRIWREIIAASLRAQSKFQLNVCGGPNQAAFRDLAQAYFGSLTPIRMHAKPSLVVHACAEEPNSLGLVPLPEIEEPGAAWWSQLAPAGEKGPRIVAKFPFIVEAEDTPSAYAIASVEQEPSGDDTTLLLAEIASGLSRTKLQALFKDAGLDAKLIATGRAQEKHVPDEVLVEVKGFIGKDDPRLAKLVEAAEDAIARMVPIGGFANPMVMTANSR